MFLRSRAYRGWVRAHPWGYAVAAAVASALFFAAFSWFIGEPVRERVFGLSNYRGVGDLAFIALFFTVLLIPLYRYREWPRAVRRIESWQRDAAARERDAAARRFE